MLSAWKKLSKMKWQRFSLHSYQLKNHFWSFHPMMDSPTECVTYCHFDSSIMMRHSFIQGIDVMLTILWEDDQTHFFFQESFVVKLLKISILCFVNLFQNWKFYYSSKLLVLIKKTSLHLFQDIWEWCLLWLFY